MLDPDRSESLKGSQVLQVLNKAFVKGWVSHHWKSHFQLSKCFSVVSSFILIENMKYQFYWPFTCPVKELKVINSFFCFDGENGPCVYPVRFSFFFIFWAAPWWPKALLERREQIRHCSILSNCLHLGGRSNLRWSDSCCVLSGHNQTYSSTPQLVVEKIW